MLVDDDSTVRLMVRAFLESATTLQVVGEAADGQAGVDLVRERSPDAVVIDGEMPRLDGWEAAAILRRERPQLVIVMFTSAPPSAEEEQPLDAVHRKSDGVHVMIEDLAARLAAQTADGPAGC